MDNDTDHPDKMAFLAFIFMYYESFDYDRNILSVYYDEYAVFNFLEMRINGNMDIEAYVLSLASTEHTIHELICASIPFDQSIDPNRKLYHYKLIGEVMYNGDVKLLFKRNFVLSIKDGYWKIIVDSYSLEQMISQPNQTQTANVANQ